MYSLSISFGPDALVWQFLFKEKEKAVEIYNTYVEHSATNATGCPLICNDDFGQSAFVPFAEIRGILFEDLDLLEEARIQRTLSNARGQAKYNERVKADPMLMRAMAQQRNGPAIHTPFGNN